MSKCKPQGIKIKVSDFKQALLNKKSIDSKLYIQLIESTIDKVQKPSILNLWNLWGVEDRTSIEININKAIKKSTNKFMMFYDFVSIDSIYWGEPNFNYFEDQLKICEIIQDEFMWVDMDTAEFVSKYCD